MTYEKRMIMLSKLREPFNGLSHFGGAIAAFFGQIALLIAGWNGTAKLVSAVVHGLSLIALFSASAAYHMAKVKPAALQTLRKLDHSAIFLLIAGTYTPFCLVAFTGFFRWGLLVVIWTIALAGILVKNFFVKAPLAERGHVRADGLALRDGCPADAVRVTGHRHGLANCGRGDLHVRRCGVCRKTLKLRPRQIRLSRSLAHLCPARCAGALCSGDGAAGCARPGLKVVVSLFNQKPSRAKVCEAFLF
jgi:hypothetical protein